MNDDPPDSPQTGWYTPTEIAELKSAARDHGIFVGVAVTLGWLLVLCVLLYFGF